MKKYSLLILVLLFSVQVFAQEEGVEESLEERYKIPEGEILKLYKSNPTTKLYFFNPVGFDRASLDYFKYLILKEPRILSIKRNAITPIVTIEITNDLSFNDLRTQVLTAKEDTDYILANYDNHIIEMERLIYVGQNK